ncbi:MAG TPA: DoxX family protein [Gemmatimonadaceae bacterium]|nr:DoxX family protein [Gemmatimonadaceae bacterium]
MEASLPDRRRLFRLLELGLAIVFIVAGTVKLAGHPFMVALFRELGFGQWLRYVTGLVELSGGLALISGRQQYLAALALAVIMVGATDASVVVFDRSPIPPFITFLALLAIAWHRRPSDDGRLGQ